MTASVVHLWRRLKWGRTLARHGALQGIEADPLTPPEVRRLVRFVSLGVSAPPTPDYARALQEIGPAAIKLGQALSTRPDLVGDRAAENLSRLQDDLPPSPFPAIKAAIETAFETPLDQLYSSFDPEPGLPAVQTAVLTALGGSAGVVPLDAALFRAQIDF